MRFKRLGGEARNLGDINYFDSDDIQYLIANKNTPLFILDLHVVRQQIARFRHAMPTVRAYYSTKTNPHPAILQIMIDQGLGFDVATLEEIKLVLGLGADPERLLSTHPIKSEQEMVEAYNLGVRKFTFDSLDELQRHERYLPLAQHFVRIAPKGNASIYDYKNKFGATDEDLANILEYAVAHHVPISGISFMVGSQSLSIAPWRDTLSYVGTVINQYYDRMPSLRTVNIGSGFPLGYRFADVTPDIDSVAAVVHDAVRDFPDDIQLIAEPGRFLVGTSTILATKVVQRLRRGNETWLYADASAYSGLIEIIESGSRFAYEISSPKNGPVTRYTISGKTLDPDDIIGTDVPLSSRITAGDILFVRDTGAYSSTFFTDYHSLSHPEIVVCDSQFARNAVLGNNRGEITGIKAKRHIRAGELVFVVSGHPSSTRTRTTFQTGHGRHVEPSLFGAFLNHSCSPNVGIRSALQPLNQLEVVAMRDIFPYEDIVADYAMFEYETGPMASINCLCGSDDCRRTITGYKDLPEAYRRKYEGFVADHLVSTSWQTVRNLTHSPL